MHELADSTDESLAGAAAAGDREAFQLLFDRCQPWVFGLCYRYLGNHHDTEDAVQEVFIKLARALPSFRGDARLRTWLYRISLTTAADFARSARRRPFASSEALEDIVSADRPAEPPEWILPALQTLSEKQRQSILLVYYQDLSHAEAATVMGCAETTISWRLFTGKRRLQTFHDQFVRPQKTP
jgi:RNA polymerase sigma-70 factor (ECF subfamily)